MTVKYIAGCENSQSTPTRFCDVFEEWERARTHLLSLILAYFYDLAPGDMAAESHLGRALSEVNSWAENTFRSVASGPDAPRFFLYPVVEREGEHRLACPRCRLDVQASEVVHGDVAGGDTAAVAFEATQPRAYRVYCEGDCGEESTEQEDLFAAIDGFMYAVTWPRQVIGDGALTFPAIRWHEEEGRWRTSGIVPPGPHVNDDDTSYFVLELVEDDDGSVRYHVDFHPDSYDAPHEMVASGSALSTADAKREAEAALRRLVLSEEMQ